VENHSQGNSKADPFPEIPDDLIIPVHTNARRNWSFAFKHASMSSKCILFGLRYLCQLNPLFEFYWKEREIVCMEWIVIEMIDWLKVCDQILMKINSGILTIGKNQTVDPQPQDELIAWMEDAYDKVERMLAERRDDERQRSEEWASIVDGRGQRS
jgi:hypothetical protein